MWTIGLCVVALVIIYYTHWINKWRNPKCNGVLPPGSMGLPLIGESLELLTPSYSVDLHPFIKKRVQRYGSMFRTNVAGRPVVVSVDPEFNHHIVQQEGRLVEIWYMDTFSKVFVLEGESKMNAAGQVHKYLRSAFLNIFGAEKLKEKLLPQIEDLVNKTLDMWSRQASVEVKSAVSAMVFDFTAEHMFSYDAEKSSEKLSEKFEHILDGFLSFPLNIPGTAYHNCLKGQKRATNILKDKLKERLASSRTRRDFLDQVINDMDKQKFLTEEFVVQLLFGGLYASFESISTVLTLIFKFLSDNPSVIAELIAEHQALLKNRENPNSPITWEEYKSMPFTLQVINETLRLGNFAPGLFRKALKDIQYKGYTIPAGWPIIVVTSALQINPDTYNDPLAFNPWRWKDLDSYTIAKNFMPFGGGTRQCAGAEYARVFLSTFIHVLVTKYRWTKLKEGTISRSPNLGLGGGIHIKFWKKDN